MNGLFVAGTDTDVGKTRVSAAIARAWRVFAPTVVKPVQTGLPPGAEGDAARAGRLAGCAWRELERFAAPADPWSAALADGRAPVTVDALLESLQACKPPLVVEGAGGIAVPLNASESFGDFASRAGLGVVVVVGLRLGCISHAVLTLEYLRARSVAIAGAILVERWGPVEAAYRNDVQRALAPHVRVAGTLAFESDPDATVERDSASFTWLETPACTLQS